VEETGPRKDKWNIPSGRLDLGESIDSTAIRQIREETGLLCEAYDLLMLRNYKYG